ncbi:hypothetical protein SEA_MEMENTOMORI_80 [Microbacterium phage MementoMori]|uniref:LPXTG cell wall anchor domain-containing protein n=1 Tax=Microbacterium phage MementoMori TaxID=2201436 RepID=A0A2Z4Q5P4_9CAUD|nr:hypothetical protein HOT41_gp29 [Microbacterium phage MementoMori]AWY05334.1 hypothetical protein SEA_MEMENTOMORI_80 [Microbacterium phage MementoMori]
MTLLEMTAEACDKYVAPASCNTENPPAIFTPPPVPETVNTALATTGGDPTLALVLLCGAALAVAVGALLVVLEARRRQVKRGQ